MRFRFKEENPFEQRKAEAANIRIKYPERVPVIIEKEHGAQVGDLDKKKFLIPSDISISQLIWIIRKRIELPQEKALFLYVGRTIPLVSASVGQVYEEHKDEDGFLYVSFSDGQPAHPHRGYYERQWKRVLTAGWTMVGNVMAAGPTLGHMERY